MKPRTVIELAQLVLEMRTAQKEYFHKRTRSALEEAKRLERDVDIALLLVMGDMPEQQELPLVL